MISKHRFLLMVIPSALALGWAGTAGAASPSLQQCQADLAACDINRSIRLQQIFIRPHSP
jgi:hypothetical protein